MVIVAVSKYQFRDPGYGDDGNLDLDGVKTDSERLREVLRQHTALLGGMTEFPPPLGPLADGEATWKNIQSRLAA